MSPLFCWASRRNPMRPQMGASGAAGTRAVIECLSANHKFPDGFWPSDGDVSMIEWMYGSTCGRRFEWSLVGARKVVCREKYPGVG